MYVLYISVFYISNRNKRFWPMNLSEISDRWTRQNFLTEISVKTFRPLFPSIFSDRNTRQTFPTAIMVRSFWRIFLTEVPSEISDRNNSSVFGQPFLTVSDRKKNFWPYRSDGQIRRKSVRVDHFRPFSNGYDGQKLLIFL